jgi:sigma-B regulation protein RsbU (phosphoserine phosphatase)
MVVPLRGTVEGDDELVGLLLFGEKESGRAYSAEEVTLLSVLSNQIAAAINNALMHEQTVQKRLMDEELATARRIQTSLLPEAPPRFGNYEVAALSVPSREVGGDYYDFITDGRQLLIAIGDVSGKGVPAALLMSMLHAGVRTQAGGRQSVSLIASRVNTLMFESTSPERFATFFLCALDHDTGRLVYTNAGHNFPVILRPNGEVECLETGGLLLGVMGDASYDEQSTPIGPGDVLVLYTDGLSEATDPDGAQFGEERVYDVLRACRGQSAAGIRESFVSAVRSHTRGAPDQDDLTLIVVKPEAV